MRVGPLAEILRARKEASTVAGTVDILHRRQVQAQ